MLDTIQYLPNYRDALKEARRVLKPGGRFICNFANKDWILFDDEYFRIRKKIPLPIEEQFFRFDEMVHSLHQAQLTVLKYKGADCFRFYAPYHRYEELVARFIPWMNRHMKKVVFMTAATETRSPPERSST
jgi:SAM-dependent methyltransferase